MRSGDRGSAFAEATADKSEGGERHTLPGSVRLQADRHASGEHRIPRLETLAALFLTCAWLGGHAFMWSAGRDAIRLLSRWDLLPPVHAQQTQTRAPQATEGGGEIKILKVRGNISVLQGAGGNITVLAFPEGVTMVDSGTEPMADKVLAAVRTLSTQPIRYIINTHVHSDHVGGNEKIGMVGRQITGGNFTAPDGAEIIAHENVLERMIAPNIKPPIPILATPGTTYHTDTLKLSTFYHGDGIQLFHAPAAHTDGDTIVFFRRHDVIATGDVFSTTNYPLIDVERGGGINGVINALNHIIDIAFPEFRLEGGTLIVPGHGRLCDSADVAYYRDMVTIIRDRVQNMIAKKMTVEQVKAAKPTQDYDPRYGTTTGPWTTDMFVEAVYKSLASKK